MTDHDLTTESSVLAYLRNSPLSDSRKVERLSDGFCGFVYRVETEGSETGATTFIVKHVQGYAARAPRFKLDQNRLYFEHEALRLLPGMLGQTAQDDVKLPKILRYDGEAHVLALEDVGSIPSLKAWLTSSSSTNTCQSIGKSLGRFLGSVHSVHLAHPSIIDLFDQNDSAKRLSALVYFDNLAEAAAKYDFDDGFIAAAAAEAREEILSAKEVFTLGDFWPGNVLVSQVSRTANNTPDVDLYMIDLELSNPGTRAFDVGQMAAELYCMAQFRGGKPGHELLESFLREYKLRARQIDVANVAIRTGAHFVMIGPSAWGEEIGMEKLRGLIAHGVDLIGMGWSRDMNALRRSIVAPLMDDIEV